MKNDAAPSNNRNMHSLLPNENLGQKWLEIGMVIVIFPKQINMEKENFRKFLKHSSIDENYENKDYLGKVYEIHIIIVTNYFSQK